MSFQNPVFIPGPTNIPEELRRACEMPTMDHYAEILAADKDHQIKVVLATHNETATGVLSDVAAVRAAMDASNHPAMLLDEGLDNVFARHARIAEGVRKAIAAWGMNLCAVSPDIYSNSVSAILTPEGFDANTLVTHASNKYGLAFGGGLGEVAGKVFRIGHLGSMSDVMALSGIATAEMCMADLGLDIKLGSGVAAAQEFYQSEFSETIQAAA